MIGEMSPKEKRLRRIHLLNLLIVEKPILTKQFDKLLPFWIKNRIFQSRHYYLQLHFFRMIDWNQEKEKHCSIIFYKYNPAEKEINNKKKDKRIDLFKGVSTEKDSTFS